MIRLPLHGETDALVALGDSTGIFGSGEADALLRDTLRAFHTGKLGGGHEVRVWADPVTDEPSGWVYFAPHDGEPGTWELYWIGVAPARHGRGIGDALLRFVEEQVEAAGGASLTIETSSSPQLARARRFYEERGYTVRVVTKDHYGRGEDKLTFMKTTPTASGEVVSPPSIPDEKVVERSVGDTVDHVSLGVNDRAAAKRFYE
jgi:ribosomal protein S18 acetylase RimI-like enzyme